jgi:hypothetical protein
MATLKLTSAIPIQDVIYKRICLQYQFHNFCHRNLHVPPTLCMLDISDARQEGTYGVGDCVEII